ncbi:MAG: alpha amylase C-terminal domain-containing protein [Syntrophaceae bacterium]
MSAERLPEFRWREIFNSDSSYYGGNNVGNGTRDIYTEWGGINVVIPANGFVVLRNA